MANVCLMCGLPVDPDEQEPGCAPGVFYHRTFCFDLAKTHIEALFDAYLANHGLMHDEQIPADALEEMRLNAFKYGSRKR